MATRTQSRHGAQRIREFILTGTADGSLRRGVKPPNERELAQRFAIPRNAVRRQSEWGKLKDRIVTPERRLKYQQEHRAVVAALKDRDDTRAKDAIITHLQHARRNLFGY